MQARSVPVTRLVYGGSAETLTRHVPVESAISIVFGAVPFAVMMASPADIEDFVTGFSLTEGIIEAAGDIRQIVVEPASADKNSGIVANVTLAPQRMSEHLQRKRSLSGRTGCGVCGVEDIGDLPSANSVEKRGRPVSIGAIQNAVLALEHHQPLNDLTRAVHGAAWFTLQGDFVLLREDVGRHNALDKLVGALLRAGADPASGFIVITSRCSFEMVEKTAIFGCPTLVAVSAPTSLAIERAEALGVTLVAIARHDSATLVVGELDEDRRLARKEQLV